MSSSVPTPVFWLIGIAVALALIPQILPPMVTMLLADANIVLVQAERIALPVAITAGVGGIIHLSSLHRTHAIALFEGSLIGLVVVSVPFLFPWLNAHLAGWFAMVGRVLGG